MDNSKPVIAAFDFDGTMTTRDSFPSFLSFAAGKWATAKKLISLSPQFAGFLIHKISRQEVKEAVLKIFFEGIPLEQLQELGMSFARSSNMAKLLRPEALKRLDWHLRQGHHCILISASINAYLDPWSRQKGFSDAICSQLAVDENGNATGLLEGLNCWGPEKTRRLIELAGPKGDYTLYAYGDSRGDQELLEMADYPFYRKMQE